jgi:thiamine pyrophosphate-dependent acetolactate synthase large subunit-like protein
VGQIASEALIERLADWGVDILVHHQEAAAFMATGYAKATGRLEVCLATSVPGGIHLLNGLYDAKLDHMPVLAITGMQETSVLGTGYQQEVALDRLYEDVAEYNQMFYNPAQVPAVVDMAVRTAYARRGVAHITVPNDSPDTTGGIGLLGTRPSEELMEEIDTLFMAGTSFPCTKHLPEAGKVRVAQIEADPARAGARVATELPAVGDAKQALAGLLPLLKQQSDTSFLEKCQKSMPYAIGMQHAFPGRQAIAYVGDGGFAMLMAEFLRYPEPFVNYAALAEANGGLGIKVERAADVRGAIQQALSHGSCAGGCQRQPRRAAAAREGRVPAGEEVHRGILDRPAAQGDDRHYALQRQDRPVQVLSWARRQKIRRYNCRRK